MALPAPVIVERMNAGQSFSVRAAVCRPRGEHWITTGQRPTPDRVVALCREQPDPSCTFDVRYQPRSIFEVIPPQGRVEILEMR